MCQAIFQILKEGKNLELCVVSYQLLLDIDKVFFFLLLRDIRYLFSLFFLHE